MAATGGGAAAPLRLDAADNFSPLAAFDGNKAHAGGSAATAMYGGGGGGGGDDLGATQGLHPCVGQCVSGKC